MKVANYEPKPLAEKVIANRWRKVGAIVIPCAIITGVIGLVELSKIEHVERAARYWFDVRWFERRTNQTRGMTRRQVRSFLGSPAADSTDAFYTYLVTDDWMEYEGPVVGEHCRLHLKQGLVTRVERFDVEQFSPWDNTAIESGWWVKRCMEQEESRLER